MWPLNVGSVQGVGECWPVQRMGPHVEHMEQPRGGRVETMIRQKHFLEGQTLSVLQVELALHAHKEEDQEVGGTKKENPVRSRIEALLLLVYLQPSCIRNGIKTTQ